MRKWIGIVAGVIVLLLLIPGLVGFLFQYQYHSLITSLNKEGVVLVQVTDYQRSWFSSRAKLQVTITDPNLKIFLKTLDIDNPKLSFVVDQEIQHGPVVKAYYHENALRLGLAAIHNKMFIAGLSAPVENDDLVTLTGNFYKYFKVPAFQYVSPDKLHVSVLDGGFGKLKIYPWEKRIRGSIELSNLKIDDNQTFISIPNFTLQFNQYRSKSGLWIGRVSLLLPEVDGHDTEGGVFTINGINFDGNTNEASEKLNDYRRLDVDRMDFANQPIGPLHVAFTAKGLVAPAIKNMLASYQKIMLEGERYQSQLTYKMAMLLPSVFGNGAEIKLSLFELDTPIGMLKMDGVMNWPVTDVSPPSSLPDLIGVGNATGKLVVSKALANKIIDIAAELPYFRSVTPETRSALIRLQSDVEMISQQNFLTISYFIDQGYITEAAGMRLIEMQKNDAPMSVYALELKTLLLKKEVVLAASYVLNWKYAAVRFNEDTLDQAVVVAQNSFVGQLREQLAVWIKAGFIRAEKDNYVVTLDKKSEKVLLNGKDIE